MIRLCSEDECNGCEACANICPHMAISMKPDIRGFIHPFIDEEKCVGCGLCKKVCSIENLTTHRNPVRAVYAAWNRNQDIRLASSSGGIFTLLADNVLKAKGVVYGAALMDDSVQHIRIDSRDGISELRGSKYVQSRMSETYKHIRDDLKNGKQVLFSGTPCQVSGLRNYLGEEYTNLICIDIICHGVPSPMVFKDYLAWLRKKQNSQVRSLSFRYKKPGWTVFSMKADYENGASYINSKFRDPYLYFFSSGGGDLTLRDSCHQCQFTSPERTGDITLGDFWQYDAEKLSQRGSEKGVSLVLINTGKGEAVFEEIKELICFEESTVALAHKSNQSLSKPWPKPKIKDQFWDDYFELGFAGVADKYCHNQDKAERWARTIAFVKAHKWWPVFKLADKMRHKT